MLHLDYAGERVFMCKWSCNFYILWMYSSKDSRKLVLWSRVVIMSVSCLNTRNSCSVPTQCIIPM